MSFIDTLGSVVKGVGGFLQSNSIASSLAKTALYGYALSKVSKSINKQNDAATDTGADVTINPSTTNSIPVIYGDAYTNGIMTDAFLANDKKTMWLCLTLSEMTGEFLDGLTDSAITITEAYYNGLRLQFQEDGITVGNVFDDEGNSSDKFSGLIKLYPFVGSSTDPVNFTTEFNGNSANAYSLFPNWTSNHQMNDLVFVLVQIAYSPQNKITNTGNFKFKVSNTMKRPGDVLYDYMNNTRYGAGIPDEEINKS